MTPEEELAKKYVDQTYNGDTDFIDEAENVISWLLREHRIIDRQAVKEIREENEAVKQIWRSHSTENPYDKGYHDGISVALTTLFGEESIPQNK